MDFTNRLKGNITQGLLETLLEDVKYRIVPLGIEEVVREVKSIDPESYLRMGLSKTLRRLPDFFVALPDLSQSWLVEVKYRKQWNERTRDALGADIREQIEQWQPVHLVIFLGESARTYDTPSSRLGVCKLVCRDDQLGVLRKVREGGLIDRGRWVEQFDPWNTVTWDSMSRFQDVFPGVSGRYEESTLTKAVSVMTSLSELDG